MTTTTTTIPRSADPFEATRADPAPPTRSSTDLLRRGGLAGLAGSAIMLSVFVFVGVVDLPSPSDAASLTTYPDIAAKRTVENSLYLGPLVLWSVHFMAIGRVLNDPATGRPPLAPWVCVFGLGSMAAGALIHVSTAVLSERYAAADATPADQEAMVAAWAAAQSVFDALLVTGAVIVPLAIVALSGALMRSVEVGRAVGRVVLGLGILGSVGGVVAVIDPGSKAGVASSILTTLVVHALVGWRLAGTGDTRTLEVEEIITIERPVADVRAQFGDVAHHQAAGVHANVRFELVDDDGHQCRYRQISRLGPLSLTQHITLTRDPDGTLVNTITKGPLAGGTITFHVEPDGLTRSRVTAVFLTENRGLRALAAPLLRRQIERDLRAALAEDKGDIEHGTYARRLAVP